MELTQRQAEILQYVIDHRGAYGRSPTFREIARKFKIASPNGIVCHIKALVKKGKVSYSPHISRSIVPKEALDRQAVVQTLADISRYCKDAPEELRMRVEKILADRKSTCPT